MDGATGAPLAALDGARLTLWRTAAASALAARFLAREDCARMVMVGAGALAPFLIRAHLSQRPLREVALWNHRPERAEALAAELAARGPAGAGRGGSRGGGARGRSRVLRDALDRARREGLVAAAAAPISTSSAPSTCAMREADDEAVRRAVVHVDTPAALTEGGDVALALKAGVVPETHVAGTLVRPLPRPLQGPPGRRRDHPVQVGRHGAGGSRGGDAGVAAGGGVTRQRTC